MHRKLLKVYCCTCLCLWQSVFASDAIEYSGVISTFVSGEAGAIKNSKPDAVKKYATFTLKANYVVNNFNLKITPFGRLDANDDERNTARLDELWMEYTAKNLDIRVGNQTFNWGSMEGVNQVDVLSPNDYIEDFITPTKIGIPAARIRWLRETGYLSVYLLPFSVSSKLPTNDMLYQVNDGLSLDMQEDSYEKQWAARYFYAGDGADVIASYYHGYESDSLINLNDSFTGLQGKKVKVNRFAIEGTKVIEDWLLKAELIYRRPEGDGFVSSYLSSLGLEYTAFSFFNHSDITFYFEYYGDTEADNVSLFRSINKKAFLGARIALNNYLSQLFEFGGLIDTSNNERYLLRIQYKMKLLDSLSFNTSYTNSAGDYFNAGRDIDGHGIVMANLEYSF